MIPSCIPIHFYSSCGEPYGGFSNFSPHGVDLDGAWWPTVEHYFQAQKFPGTPHADAILKAGSPKLAKELSRTRRFPLRPDWEGVNLFVATNQPWRTRDSGSGLASVIRTARQKRRNMELPMGLDTVELIMGIEEAFDIEIPDEAAEELSTVGQMYAFVVSKLALNQSRRCMSSAIFYRARRALVDLHGIQRRSVSPSVRMEALLPSRRRRAHWQSLSRAMGVRLPNLELPRWMGRLSNGLVLAILLTCLAAYFVYPVSIAIFYSLGSVLLMWAAHRIAAPFAVQIPAQCATVGGTVRAVLRLNHGTHARTPRTWDPNEVWETLRKVVAEQLDVPLEAVTTGADCVKDLGAD